MAKIINKIAQHTYYANPTDENGEQSFVRVTRVINEYANGIKKVAYESKEGILQPGATKISEKSYLHNIEIKNKKFKAQRDKVLQKANDKRKLALEKLEALGLTVTDIKLIVNG